MSSRQARVRARARTAELKFRGYAFTVGPAAPEVVPGWRHGPQWSRRRTWRRLPNSPQPAVTLLAALLAEREGKVTDSLVDLLIVHRIGARAER